ncbi:MAG TPA: methyltransferase type 11 [Cyanobacteria bacterium UBA11149]|nr:methyltransferase type 11 [Cyanobacteria bacterium UBA11367]HBE60936.1 methyltransferase type 11 [Cyanobacteria bacterium UBA11366]HBK62438.1 methyltransferase type 11 [Cyanobacteria bacterium UBA11166]HBR76398.1 methyltransferase type 11 [Cyanobacteria bacterium UBA11159]HBS72053.1 methyltransferase type 11 [Cyanobacteria bacterium UBA11153]HBW89748.1 methyltransferase type 11 [Cyanobacteria bacterium UBA11149]HCA95466.1 methyltransferase type 11 [Cyanobacteria bacterium UBA9226]
MIETLKLTESTQEQLCCPICHSKLLEEAEIFLCTNSQCQAKFPIVDRIPVLINESASIFSLRDFVDRQNTTFNITPTSKIKRILVNLVPQNSVNIQGSKNYKILTELLLKQSEKPKVLVLGGGILGQGMEALASVPSIDIIASDVSFGPETSLICDAHDIPFKDKSFDGVIAQAVLEHVVDPIRCVEEIHRVLKDNGLVYAETPFMQQVHMGRYDFTRFTHLGHRRLFRKFEEVCSGVGCGSGMALSWAYQYFLLSFFKSQVAQEFAIAFARITSFWLKYFDYYLVNKPGTFDGASAYYFLGRKSDCVLSDRDLIKMYKGIRGGISPEF